MKLIATILVLLAAVQIASAQTEEDMIHLSAPILSGQTEDTCAEYAPADVSSFCYDMEVYNVWQPDAGTICISILDSIMTVEFSAVGYWQIFQANVWWGDNIANLPMIPDSTTPDLHDFSNSSFSIGGKDTYELQVDLTGIACDGNDEYMLTVLAHAMLGEACIPPSGTFLFGTDHHATAGPNKIGDPEMPFNYITKSIACTCQRMEDKSGTDQDGESGTNLVLATPPASGSGDPHFKTWTGDKFDYHGECDLALVHNPDFGDGLGLYIHIRTTRVKYFSYIETIAIRIGSQTLEFNNDVSNFKINGRPVKATKKHVDTRLAGFLVRRDSKAVSIRLDTDSRAKIDLIQRRNGFPAVLLDGGDDHILFEGSLGLLGDWATGKRMARDGKTEMHDEDTTDYALEWQVRDTDPQLFSESRYPQYPTQCTPPKKMGSRLGKSHMEKAAEEACSHWVQDKEDCIFDVIATRDVMVALEGSVVA